MKKAKKVFSVRINPELMKKAVDMGGNISTIIQSSIEEFIKEKRCPTCGKKI